MKYLDEFRSPEDAKRITAQIHEVVTQPWGVMEVCGGQTHSIVRFGIDQMLPDLVSLIHGPGCPVCVTPVELIDQALAIAARPEVIFCSFGDMLRVPGTQTDLFRVKAEGGDVRVVYSPMDALKLAMANPDRQVVFFGVGFETTSRSCPTSPCWCPTCWYRRRSRRWPRRRIGRCTASWPRVTCAR